MKKSKIAILSLGMALCLGGGVGAAFAMTKSGATSTGTATFDNAIFLCWGSKSSTATIDDVTSFEDGAAYRYLAVTPESSATVAGTVTVSFTLSLNESVTDATPVLTGLSVKVYETTDLATDLTVETLLEENTALVTLTEENLTDDVTFDVETSKTAHETNKYYVLEIAYDGSILGAGEQLGGILTISQSFALDA